LTQQRRTLKWVNVESDFTALAAGSQTNLLLFNEAVFGALTVKGMTVTRLLFDLKIRSDSLAQLNQLHYGIAIVNADARAAGAFPDANDMADRANWLVRGKLENQMTAQDTSQWTTMERDLRAQRVFRNEEEELHLIIRNSTSNVLSWSTFTRILMKLP